MNVLSKEECLKIYSNIKDYHICVANFGVTSVCPGDSGGPLSCKVNGRWKVFGATSWLSWGCNKDKPSVYASVPFYRSWIREVSGI